MKLFTTSLIALSGLSALTSAQNSSNADLNNVKVLTDPGTAGPQPEIVHLYYDEWPTGIAVSSSGRKFSNYPPALDPADMKYTVAELVGNNREVPYPSAEINSPPGGRINYTTYPPTGANYRNYFIGVQSVVVDPADRLWVLDTGRVATQNGTMLQASYGGPKLVGINLSNNKIFKTIVFSTTAAPGDSYLNDIRFDLNPSLTASGQGVAYITDSSPEGRNAIVIVDLGSGEAWRHLTMIPSTQATPGFVPYVWGQPIYQTNPGPFYGNLAFGADGIAISPDGKTLYWSTTGGRRLYSISTARLLDRGPTSELQARAAVMDHGEKGLTDGLESDSNGIVYGGSIEDNSIFTFDPKTGITSQFSRDPRYSWTDTLSVATDGYIYYTENQLVRGAAYNNGQDKRVKPYVLFRVKCLNGGTKITQPAPKQNGANNATMLMHRDVHYE